MCVSFPAGTSAGIDQQLAALRPNLLAIARLQLRNDTWAEDVVSETLIAALEGAQQFAAQSQLKTWVVGILKHKIIDQFRRAKREVSADAELESAEVETFDELFAPDGHRIGAASDWGNPEASFERVEFFEMPALPVSSSDIRVRVANGESVGDLVPPAVAREIDRRGLYR